MEKIKPKFIIFIVSPLVIFFVLFSVYDFYLVLQQKEYELRKKSLREIANQSTVLLDNKIESYIKTLNGLSIFFTNEESSKNILENIPNIIEKTKFHYIGWVNENGTIFATTNGTDFEQKDIANTDYWNKISNNEIIVTRKMNSMIDQNEIFAISIPVYNNQNGIIAIQASIKVKDFIEKDLTNLTVDNYNISIIDEFGNFLVNNFHSRNLVNDDNIIDFLSQNTNITKSKAKLYLDSRSKGVEEIFFGEEKFLGAITPLENSSWFTVVTIPNNSIKNHINLLLEKYVLILIAKLMFIFSFLLATIIYIIRKENIIAQRKESEIRNRLFSDIEGFIQADLEEDKIIYCSDSLNLKTCANLTFSQLIDYYIEKRTHEDYHLVLKKLLNKENIEDIYSHGINCLTQDYYITDNLLNKIWNQCEIHIENDAITNHLSLFFIIRNIDEKKRSDMKLREKAEHDQLTGLYNRNTATEMINQILTESIDDNEQHAFVIFDLDNFKTLNDKLLHKTGDKALQDVAEILVSFFRTSDIVARLGGDEFIVFLRNTQKETLNAKLTTLLEKLHLTYKKDNIEVSITASAGVSLAPSQGSSFKDLYIKADLALYNSKKAGKAIHSFYLDDEKVN